MTDSGPAPARLSEVLGGTGEQPEEMAPQSSSGPSAGGGRRRGHGRVL